MWGTQAKFGEFAREFCGSEGRPLLRVVVARQRLDVEHFRGQADFKGPLEVRAWLASIANGLEAHPAPRRRAEPSSL